ncbi:MAG: DUF2793 domain-containing protein [Xanthobacteraceae bacterium]
MSETTNLGLPFLEAGQAQKHVTLNEALRILDTAIHLSAVAISSLPPGSPEEGERHIVAPEATGAFASYDNAVATYQDAAWQFLVPRTGWRAWLEAEEILVVFDGEAWRDLRDLSVSLDDVTRIGVNTLSEGDNRLAVRSNAAVLSAIADADGGTGDARLQISKEAESNTASVFFSNDFEGRAEFGLVGGDDFKLKVSADGEDWVESLIVDPASGSVSFARGLALEGEVSPAEIGADQNDYAPSGFAGASVLRLSTDATRSLTGLAGGAAGRVVIIQNIGGSPLRLKNENAASSAANRFALSADITLAANQCAVLRYDAGASRWRALAAPSAAPEGGGGDLSPLHLAVAKLQMRLADLAGAPVNWIGAISDSFDGTTGLNTGGSTAMDVSEAGVIKPTSSSGANQLPAMTAATTSGVTMAATTEYSGSFSAWKAADGNASTWWVANGAVPQNLDADFGSGNAKTIASYKMRARNDGSPLGPTAWELLGSNDASSWSTLDSRAAQSFTSGELKTFAVASPGSYRYYRLAVSATGAGSNLSLGEYELHSAGSVNNMTAISNTFGLSAEPDSIDLFFVIEKADAMTPDTDYVVSVSIDGGANFDAGSIEELGTAGSLTVCRAASIDVSARSGTSLCWKIETHNNKSCKIHDLAARAY